MVTMNLGVFSDKSSAEAAVHDLQDAGYDPKNISIMMKSQNEARDMANETGASVASGVTAGATTGGIIGGIAGLLIGIGAITIPGLGALMIGGPIAAALGLTGAAATTVSGAATGALAGGLVGALTRLGVPEDRAKEYEETIREGGVLLAVPEESMGGRDSRMIMEEHGADQVNSVDIRETTSL